MSFDLAGVAAVFGDDESAVRWSYELLCKVIMFTFEISLPSVKPATGGIDEPGVIQFAEQGSELFRIKLSPAFIEDHPGADAWGMLLGQRQFLCIRG